MSDSSLVFAERIDDLVLGTLKDLGRNSITQIAQELQEYEIMGKWLKEEKVMFDDGYGIRRTLMTKFSQAARHTGLFAPDTVDVPKLLTEVSVPWRHASTTWAYELREMMINKGQARINNIIQPRRVSAMIALAEELENKAWEVPDSTDEVLPYGIPYWIVPNQTQGFNGGAASGFTTVGGVNLTNHPTFKNWTDSYTSVSKGDLIKKMRKGFRFTEWKSPVTIDQFRGTQGMRRRYYMNYDTLAAFEEVGEAQNDNLGRDLAPYDGEMTFRRIPLKHVFKLDEVSGGLIYGVDHEAFFPVCLRGDYFRETPPERAPGQRNVRTVACDLTYNYLCTNRRTQQVYTLATG
jgi:hypothetical protein